MTGPHLTTRAGAVTSRGRNASSGAPGSPRGTGRSSWGARAARLLGRHWLLVVLLAAGLALRIAAQIAYQPALIYVDTLKYLYGASPGADPLGYTLVLRSFLVLGNLSLVALAQDGRLRYDFQPHPENPPDPATWYSVDTSEK